MAPIDSGEPRPLEQLVSLPRWTPHIDLCLSLPPDSEQRVVRFEDVLDARRTTRELRPVSIERLGVWLWHAARTRGSGRNGWEHRAAPSAGGLHPIELVLIPENATEAYHYDPLRHTLGKLTDIDMANHRRACADLRAIVPSAHGFLVLLAGHLARTAALYENPASLLWRDAGCLLATLQLVACWLNLGICPLGALGQELTRALSADEQLVAAGTLVVGEI